MFPKPSEVQNDLYANNEDEEDEGEDVEGKKVAVRCCQNFGISKQGTPKAFSTNILTVPLLCPCVLTGLLHQKWTGGGPQGSGLTCWRLVSHDRHDEHWGEGQSGPAPTQRLS